MEGFKSSPKPISPAISKKSGTVEKKSHRKTEKNERNGNQDQRLKCKSRPLEIESTVSTAAKRAVGTRIRKFEK